MSALTLRQQFAELLRALPGFMLGAPTRWMLGMHDSAEEIDGRPYCPSLLHRRPVEWPCREYMDAVEALHEHPEWI